MTDEAVRRRYRRLLWTYPAAYRAERGEEIVDTLVESAPPDRTRPAVREAVDLAVSGLLTRLGFGYVPGLAGGAAWAAAVSLAVAGGLGAFFWLSRPCCPAGPTSLAMAMWPATAALVALLPRFGRPVIAATLLVAPVLVALELVVGSPATAVLAPGYVVPGTFAAVALLGWRRDATREHRLVAGLGVPVTLAVTMIMGTVIPLRDAYPLSRLPGTLRTSIGSADPLAATMLHPLGPAWLGAVVLTAAVLAVVALGRADRRWLWCALLLAIPALPLTRMAFGWIANPGYRLLWYPEAMLTALAMAAAVAVGIWIAGRHHGSATATEAGPTGALTAAAGVALAAAAGLAGGFWLHSEVLAEGVRAGAPFGSFRAPGPVIYAAWLLAAAAYVAAGARVARLVTAIALAATVLLPVPDQWGFASPHPAELGPLVILGAIALAAMGDRAGALARSGVALATTGFGLVAVYFAVVRDPTGVPVAEALTGPVAIPYAVAAVAGGVALRLGHRPVPSTVVVAVAAVGLSGVVPSTYTEYLVAVVAAVTAAAIAMVGGAVSMLRKRT